MTETSKNYCSIPDFVLDKSETAQWFQRKFGDYGGECYRHDKNIKNRRSDDQFLADCQDAIRKMDIIELRALGFSVVKDAHGLVVFHRDSKRSFKYRLFSKFLSFNNSQ